MEQHILEEAHLFSIRIVMLLRIYGLLVMRYRAIVFIRCSHVRKHHLLDVELAGDVILPGFVPIFVLLQLRQTVLRVLLREDNIYLFL